MSVIHDEIEIEDMDWHEELQAFTYQCPCGDLFQITIVINSIFDTCFVSNFKIIGAIDEWRGYCRLSQLYSLYSSHL